MIENIIFDWSGCLIDDLVRSYQISMFCLEKLGAKRISLKEYKERFTLPYMNFYRQFTDAPKKRLNELFVEGLHLAEKSKPFPSTGKVLEFLKRKNINMALLTSHPRKELSNELKEFGFEKYFIDVESDVHDKTKVINNLIKRNNFLKKKTAYIGDMTHDIDAGKKAGVITIAIFWGFQSKEKLANKNPDYLIGDLVELKGIFS